MQHYDLAIIGGGLVGCSLAAALKALPINIALIEAKPLPTFSQSALDTRAIALALGSSRIMQGLDVWSDLQAHATPIKQIHVSEQGRFASARMQADKFQLPAFGYVTPIQQLFEVLQTNMQSLHNLTVYCPTQLTQLDTSQQPSVLSLQQADTSLQIKADLVVAADGANSFVRELLGQSVETIDYQQTAIVANIKLNRAHDYIAFERFTKQGVMAFLPMPERRATLIWSTNTGKAQQLLALDDDAFIAAAQQAFGYRLGRLLQVGRRNHYPIKTTVMPKAWQPGVLWLGNAAHALNPIAAQGFNLSLRDIAVLAELIHDACLAQQPLSDSKLLQAYSEQRQADQQQVMQLTDVLARCFTWPLGFTRGMGLWLFDRCKLLQQAMINRTLGFQHAGKQLSAGQALRWSQHD